MSAKPTEEQIRAAARQHEAAEFHQYGLCPPQITEGWKNRFWPSWEGYDVFREEVEAARAERQEK